MTTAARADFLAAAPVARGRRMRVGGVFAIGWIALSAIYGSLLYTQSAGAMGPWLSMRAGFEGAGMPALLGLCVWWLTSRIALPESHFASFAGLHLVAGVLFATAWTWWVFFLMGPEGRARMPADTLSHVVLPWQFVFGLLVYGIIGSASYAVRGALSSRDLRLAAERSERLRAQADLATLRAHINPHFLFNTLHSVTELMQSAPEQAEEALARLADLFRYTLRLDRERLELVTLEDEWQFTSSYLWLERMRLGDRLHVDAQLDEDALACDVPPFTLQPLVENAVRHGLSAKPAGGTIVIRAHEQRGALAIDVRDDGVGAAPDAVLAAPGLGVRSVRQRLAARYGGAATVRVTGSVGTGVAVSVSLPTESVG